MDATIALNLQNHYSRHFLTISSCYANVPHYEVIEHLWQYRIIHFQLLLEYSGQKLNNCYTEIRRRNKREANGVCCSPQVWLNLLDKGSIKESFQDCWLTGTEYSGTGLENTAVLLVLTHAT